MLLLMQSYCTDNRKLESTEIINISPVQTCVVRLGQSSDVDVIGIATALILSGGTDKSNNKDNTPSLLGQYHAFKAVYFTASKDEDHKQDGDKRKFLIAVESSDINQILEDIAPKLKKMSLNDKDALARELSDKYSRIDLIEEGSCNAPSDEEVRAVFVRLLCVMSMQFDVDFINLNDEKVADIKGVFKGIVEKGYENSIEKKLLYSAKDSGGLMEGLNSKKGELDAFMESHEKSLHKLESSVLTNKEIQNYYLVSQLANASGSIH